MENWPGSPERGLDLAITMIFLPEGLITFVGIGIGLRYDVTLENKAIFLGIVAGISVGVIVTPTFDNGGSWRKKCN